MRALADALSLADADRAALTASVPDRVRSQRSDEAPAASGTCSKTGSPDLDDFADPIRWIAQGGSIIDPAVVAVLDGRRSRVPLDDLTDRERCVLALMAEGRSSQAIGDQLSMARKTVEAHIANIFSKLELLPAADDHRRVLAVLAHLRGPAAAPTDSHRGW